MKKSFVLGFLLATLLFSAIPVGAAVQEYILTSTASKLVVDGVEVKNDTLPMMSYNGYNYIPASSFRDICDKIGVGFEWNDTTKAIEIDTSVATAETTIISTGVDIMSDKITQTPDGIPVFQYNEENYIGWLELRKKCESLGLKFKIRDNAFEFLNADDSSICSLALATTYDPYDSAKYSDYINIALPLIQQGA